MSYFFIINPKAGKKKDFVKDIIIKHFSLKKINFEIKYTEYKNHASELARIALIKGYRYIIVSGGDGTIRESAEPLLMKEDAILGIIPSGSGNGLARNLNIPMNIEESIKGLLLWPQRKIDSILCNNIPFFCSSGVGIDASIAYFYNNTKHSRGIFPYYLNALKVFLNYKPNKVSIFFDDKEFTFYPLIASVFNGEQYGGGARMAPSAYIDDGYLDIVVLDNIKPFKAIYRVKDLFNGRILENDFAKSYKTKKVEFRIPAGSYYHLDGDDFFSEDGVLRFSILPSSLKVICPILK